MGTIIVIPSRRDPHMLPLAVSPLVIVFGHAHTEF